MWESLAECSKDRIENHYSDNSFETMRKLLRRLKDKEYAEAVFAFTSLYTFIITLQSAYNTIPKDSISISFDDRNRFFTIIYYDEKSIRNVKYICVETQAESLIDALVLRMFLQKI